MKNMMKDIKSVLIDKERLDARVAELGRQITEDYQGRDVVLIGILKGAMPFLCDLMRAIDLPVTLDTMCVSSYGSGTVSSGSVNIKKIWIKTSAARTSSSWKTSSIRASPWRRWCRFSKAGSRFGGAGDLPR